MVASALVFTTFVRALFAGASPGIVGPTSQPPGATPPSVVLKEDPHRTAPPAPPATKTNAPVQAREARPEEKKLRSYAGAIVFTDITAFIGGVLLATSGGESAVPLILPVIASPIVHLAYGNKASAGLSLAMRLTVPLSFAFVGYVVDEAHCEPEDWCGLIGALYGLLAGVVTTTIVDAAVLAKRPVEPRKGLAWMPVLDVTPRGAALGVRGAF